MTNEFHDPLKHFPQGWTQTTANTDTRAQTSTISDTERELRAEVERLKMQLAFIHMHDVNGVRHDEALLRECYETIRGGDSPDIKQQLKQRLGL